MQRLSSRPSRVCFSIAALANVAAIACSDDPAPVTQQTPTPTPSSSPPPPPPPDAATALTLLGTNPPALATNVATTTTVTATFSADLNAATVSSTSMTLKSALDTVTGTYAVTGAVATLTPSSPLSLLTKYDLALSNTIAGNGLLPFAGGTSSFTTRDGAWQTPQLAHAADVADADQATIAVDLAGNAFAMWRQSDAVGHSVWRRRYTAASGSWDAAIRVDEAAGGTNANGPSVAFDAAGNATAVWHQEMGGTFDVFTSRFSAATNSWSANTKLDTETPGSSNVRPALAIDGGGNAMVVWSREVSETESNVWANRFDAASGTWGGATSIETDPGSAYFPQVAIDAAGNASVVWENYTGTRTNIWGSRFTGGLWTSAALLETDDSGNAAYPYVAADGLGNAMATWSQKDATRANIMVSRFAAGAWGAPIRIDTDNTGDARNPRLAFDPAGNAFVAWQHTDDDTFNRVVVNRLGAGSTSWGGAMLVDDPGTLGYFPNLAFDRAGHGLLTWTLLDRATNGKSLVSNRYNAIDGTWGSSTSLKTTANVSFQNAIAFDPAGNAFAVWDQSDGAVRHVMSNRFE